MGKKAWARACAADGDTARISAIAFVVAVANLLARGLDREAPMRVQVVSAAIQ
jgi:hypothetical protein